MAVKFSLILHHIKKLQRGLSDLFFPLLCVSCNREGSVLCGVCASLMPPLLPSRCPWCSVVSYDGMSCSTCLKIFGIEQLLAVSSYAHWRARAVVHACKYQGSRDAAAWMGSRMADMWRVHGRAGEYAILPIPLHVRRRRERGFNQAEDMARAFSAPTGFPVFSDVLFRARSTVSQTHLSSHDRRENMRNAFRVRNVEHVVGKSIILIDDVCTSGSTVQASARVLKEAGALSVRALVFARG